MLLKYIEEALRKARYEIIEDEEPYYGEIPELQRVWATGGTLQECRENLREVLEEVDFVKSNIQSPMSVWFNDRRIDI
ncbi:MAG: type II toxin-antitoxin system HicB family antitoxin [Candidatus Latescibacterota bacterium]|nr:MAG: type II toxin-antitoxin system HicB family antitoxin [Candidatus Latescibacterota bacterium]